MEGNITLWNINPNFLIEIQLNLQLIRAEKGVCGNALQVFYMNLINLTHPSNQPPPPDLTLDNMNFNQIFVNIRLTLIIVV